MDKKQQEALNRKKSNETFNSITQKVKPENQNQQHNADLRLWSRKSGRFKIVPQKSIKTC